jgi:hypothetical protein
MLIGFGPLGFVTRSKTSLHAISYSLWYGGFDLMKQGISDIQSKILHQTLALYNPVQYGGLSLP